MGIEERPDCLRLRLNTEKPFTTFRALEIVVCCLRLVLHNPEPHFRFAYHREPHYTFKMISPPMGREWSILLSDPPQSLTFLVL